MTRPKQHFLTFPGRLLVPHLVESNLYDDGVGGSSVCYLKILIFGIFIWGSLSLRGWRHWRCSENPSRSYPFVRDVHIYLFQVYLSIQVFMPNVALPLTIPRSRAVGSSHGASRPETFTSMREISVCKGVSSAVWGRRKGVSPNLQKLSTLIKGKDCNLNVHNNLALVYWTLPRASLLRRWHPSPQHLLSLAGDSI